MLLTTFIIVLLFIIALSNILDSAFPNLPLPIIQIGLGVVIALSPINIQIDLQPEFFLGIFIAPLLYREAEEADLFSLWKVRKEVIFMVFGLVFATVMVIGFSAYFLLAAIPLAACFCLGGILGPTDPIAVKSVYSRIDIDNDSMNILKGESLINDSSGVIAFSFAAIALTTGEFSVPQMSLTFIYMCVAGVLIGFVIATLKNFIVRTLKHSQIQNAAAFTIIEMLVPFICFFVAEGVGANGILAVVAAGTRQALLVRRVEVFEARFAVIKRSLWDMIKGVFNSFIFILLGLELPRVIASVYNDASLSVPQAIRIGLLLTGIMFAIRFLGILVAAREKNIESAKERRRNRIVLTLSGVKGTISLAVAFSLPTFTTSGSFTHGRDLLLLITACVIIFSLVISNILLPCIARIRVQENKNEGLMTVLKEVVDRIEDDTTEQHEAIVMRLKRRILELELEDRGKSEMRRFRHIRNEFFSKEIQVLEKKLINGEYTRAEYLAYGRVQELLGEIQNDSVMLRYQNRILSFFNAVFLSGKRRKLREEIRETKTPPVPIDKNRLREIFWDVTDEVIDIMGKEYKEKDNRLFSHVVEERIESARTVLRYVGGDEIQENRDLRNYIDLKKSYDIEREIIFEFLEEGRISEEEADDLRVQVNTLENFTIEEMQNDMATRFYLQGAERRIRRRRNKRDNRYNRRKEDRER